MMKTTQRREGQNSLTSGLDWLANAFLHTLSVFSSVLDLPRNEFAMPGVGSLDAIQTTGVGHQDRRICVCHHIYPSLTGFRCLHWVSDDN